MDDGRYIRAFKKMKPGDSYDTTTMKDPETFIEQAKLFMDDNLHPNLTFNSDYSKLTCIVTIIIKDN